MLPELVYTKKKCFSPLLFAKRTTQQSPRNNAITLETRTHQSPRNKVITLETRTHQSPKNFYHNLPSKSLPPSHPSSLSSSPACFPPNISHQTQKRAKKQQSGASRSRPEAVSRLSDPA